MYSVICRSAVGQAVLDYLTLRNVRNHSPNTSVTSKKTRTVSLTNFSKIPKIIIHVVPEHFVFFTLFAFSEDGNLFYTRMRTNS
jgi:hypothetical protein